MKVGVARETMAGERRVALVPETAGKLIAAGFEVIVEPGAGVAASFPDDTLRSGRRDARLALGRRCGGEGAKAGRGGGRAAPRGTGADRLPRSAGRPRRRCAPRVARRARIRHGVDPAHDARAVDGCAVLAGDRRRLQGRAPRRGASPPLLSDADDRGRHGAACEGARDRRRRRGPAGDRDSTPARRRRHRLRRPPGRARADRESRRELARPRHRRAPKAKAATRES